MGIHLSPPQAGIRYNPLTHSSVLLKTLWALQLQYCQWKGPFSLQPTPCSTYTRHRLRTTVATFTTYSCQRATFASMLRSVSDSSERPLSGCDIVSNIPLYFPVDGGHVSLHLLQWSRRQFVLAQLRLAPAFIQFINSIWSSYSHLRSTCCPPHPMRYHRLGHFLAFSSDVFEAMSDRSPFSSTEPCTVTGA